MGRFPWQLLRRTELIKRSLRLDEETKWWCQEPLQVVPLSNCFVSDACEPRTLIRTTVGGLRPPLCMPISGALLQIQRLCLCARLDRNISQVPRVRVRKTMVQIDSFSFLREYEKSILVFGSHVAPLSVVYSLLIGIDQPMREHSRTGPAPDRPYFRSEMGSVRLGPHF